jgi:hypothetical protein
MLRRRASVVVLGIWILIHLRGVFPCCAARNRADAVDILHFTSRLTQLNSVSSGQSHQFGQTGLIPAFLSFLLALLFV